MRTITNVLSPVATIACFVAAFCAAPSRAQTSGNSVYGNADAKARAEAREQAIRLAPMPALNDKSVTIDARVLMNVKADAFVAVFGVATEGETVAQAQQKMAAIIGEFTTSLKPLGVGASDMDVDFVAQNKVYGYEINDTLAKEKLTGFELKKNVIVHYKNKTLLDALVKAAADAQIFDLIKVDYVVTNTALVKTRLHVEAARVVKEKIAGYKTLLGLSLSSASQILADRESTYYPGELYDGYTAAESENVDFRYDRSKFTVQSARKTRTFYFNGLSGNGFDTVINPVVIEPVVQFTLYLKVRCDAKNAKPATQKATPRKSNTYARPIAIIPDVLRDLRANRTAERR